MTETRWWKYMQSLMNGQSQLDAAQQIGISKSNITRWKDGARAAPDFVVKVARAYGANVLEALVEAEFITEQEANFTTSYTERDMLRWLRDSALILYVSLVGAALAFRVFAGQRCPVSPVILAVMGAMGRGVGRMRDSVPP